MNNQDTFAQPLKMFVVAILCKSGRYERFMSSGINEDRKGRFSHTTDRAKAQKFAKLTAENLVERLRKEYRLTAQVEAE